MRSSKFEFYTVLLVCALALLVIFLRKNPSINRRLNQLAGAIMLAGVLWYVISLTLEIRGLRKMCSQIEVGSTLDVTKSRVREFGFYRLKESKALPGFLGANGIYDWPIPSPMTLGDYACVISHDGFKVLTVQMSER